MLQSGLTALQQVTVPLYIEHNRPFVDFTCIGDDGNAHTARFWIDTGGGSFLITEALARKLGISWQEVFEGDEGVFAPFVPPLVTLAGMPLHLAGAKALVAPEPSPHFVPVPSVDGIIGGHILARYAVIFDYPHRQFTLAAPGALTLQGAAFPTPMHPRSGFPRIEVQIGEQTYGMLLDTGASHTMISRTLLDELATLHPTWPQASEAVGTANMGYSRVDRGAQMLRLPELVIGAFHLADVSVVSKRAGVFEEWMADTMTGPIIGALGGNVLKCFRLSIDYAEQTTYLEQHAEPERHDMDVVGLTLEPQTDGSHLIIHVATHTSNARVTDSVQIGDKLLSVDGQSMTGLSLAHVVDALRGIPGQERLLQLERAGHVVEVSVPVARIL